ncbi:MAG: isoprenylcysteine carboxylmethyltransferase family protein [Ignavibacteriota bacterium]|nr:isoprenylcysteine carboxylmethyltransferase family protein [Ignavibacteriota bacterium]QKJ96091.1 MAG: isoprenylcysteine carboxylmethyltransferase family protein [Ignavibacteriota bacterium]
MMLANKISFAITIIMWIVFAIAFLLLKRRQKQNEQKKNKLAMIGMMLEGVGFAFVFTVRREPFTNIFQMNSSIQILLTIFSGILAIASVWLGLSAVKTLGKQWNIKAQIIEGHELITTGPYKIVRHPIYSALFGLLIVTGYSITQLWAFIIAIVFYFIGTIFRTRVEEQLLIQHFGDQYEKYKKKVPAIIPFIF